MLTIVDLNRNEELSSSEMGKVGGGMSCEQVGAESDFYSAAAGAFRAAGLDGAADQMAWGYYMIGDIYTSTCT
jgi:hypothetical protein